MSGRIFSVNSNPSLPFAPEGLEKLGFERYIVKVNLVHNQLAEIVDATLAKLAK